MVTGALVYVHRGPAPVPHFLGYLEASLASQAAPRVIVAVSGQHELFGQLRTDRRIQLVDTDTMARSAKQEKFGSIVDGRVGFRQGFWRNTIDRFMVIDRLAEDMKLESFFHLENDNVIFFDAVEIAGRLKSLYAGIGATFDADDRCIPGIVYVNDRAALSAFTDFLLKAYGADTSLTDMGLLAAFRAEAPPGVIDTLPIVPPAYPKPLASRSGHVPGNPGIYSNNFDALASVFDAAALGQYLFGIDRRKIVPKETRGFVNETCVFDPSVFSYHFIPGPNGWLRPVMRLGDQVWPINNLHAHSKRPLDFRPQAPTLDPTRRRDFRLRRFSPGSLGKRLERFLTSRPPFGDPVPRRHRRTPDGNTYRALLAQREASSLNETLTPVDVMIPMGRSDIATAPLTVDSVRRNLSHPIGSINIIAASSPGLCELCDRLNVSLIDQDTVLPFRRDQLHYTPLGQDRSGWLFAQLVKLGSSAIGRSAGVFIIDADVALTRPQTFESGGKAVLLAARQHHAPYFQGTRKVLGRPTVTDISCIADMAFIRRDRLLALQAHIADYTGKQWCQAIIEATDWSTGSGFADYEVIAQWLLSEHPEETTMALSHNLSLGRSFLAPVPRLEQLYGERFRSVSFHNYMPPRSYPYYPT